MAKPTVMDSPQESLIGSFPNPKGGDMATQNHHLEGIVNDPQTEAPIDTTFYVDVPYSKKDVIEHSPQNSSIAKGKM